jgi:hypothetical protein
MLCQYLVQLAEDAGDVVNATLRRHPVEALAVRATDRIPRTRRHQNGKSSPPAGRGRGVIGSRVSRGSPRGMTCRF